MQSQSNLAEDGAELRKKRRIQKKQGIQTISNLSLHITHMDKRQRSARKSLLFHKILVYNEDKNNFLTGFS